MEMVCVKLDESLSSRLKKNLKSMGYSTKTEFVREAIRKKLEEDEKENLIKQFLKYKGKGNKTSDDESTAEQVLMELARERGWEV